jgi:murein DD-endopeptidase MepM/ murein hydrolase activator NlpD
MSAGSGDAISAAAGGRVILAGWFGGYGNCVVVDHGGGVSTLYAHQTSVAVSYGDSVSAGDTVGYVGSTGLSTGPHLHFEVRVDGNPVDPSGYL